MGQAKRAINTFKILITILLAVYSLYFFKKPNKYNNDFQKVRNIKITWKAFQNTYVLLKQRHLRWGGDRRTKNMCILRKAASQMTP